MKGFLLDENLPGNLRFTPSLPVVHVAALGTSAPDSFLWDWAKEHDFVIVTKDADFSHRILLSRPPPWVVHLRFGNLGRQAFHELPAKVWPGIEDLLPGHKLVDVYADRLEAVM